MKLSVALLRVAPVAISALLYALFAPIGAVALWILALVCGAGIPWIDKSVSLPPLGRLANGARAAAGAALGLAVGAAIADLPWTMAFAPLL